MYNHVRPALLGPNFSLHRKPSLPKARLCRASVDQALATWTKGQKLRLWFENPKGLFLSISPLGAASWRLLYTKPDGSRSEITLAAENEITPQIAGEKARQILAEALMTGIDPMASRRAKVAEAKASKSKTFRSIAEKYLAAHSHVSARTAEHRTYMLEKHIYPRIGEREAETLRRPELKAMLREIQRSVTPSERNLETPGFRLANACGALTAAVFEFGVDEELLQHNPARFRKLFPQEPLARLNRLDPNRVRLIWNAIEEAGRENIRGKQTSIAMLLGILLAQRPREISAIHRQDLNFETRMWTPIQSRNKTNSVYSVFLPDYAASLLAEAFRLAGDTSPWAFPRVDGSGPMLPNVMELYFRRVRDRLLKSGKLASKDVAYYDFRRWARGAIESTLGFPEHIAEKVLSHHHSREMRRRYDAIDHNPQVKNAFVAYEKYILSIVHNEPVPDNLTHIHQRVRVAE